jgi:ribosomal protein L3 glutamine methyltransferase
MTTSDPTTDLLTVRDFVRYAVSRFTAAELTYGHGTTNAFDEAAFMVLEGLSLPVDQLEPWWDARLIASERQKLAGLIEARVTTRKPAPYLLNRAYINGMPFYVDERVIVPRSFIGEILCGDDASMFLDDVGEIESALDLCTGSGCLAILAAHLFPEATIDAVDLSPDALDVARKNVATHKIADRLTLFQGDLFAPLKGHSYDLIITNPPYVDAEAMNDLPPEFQHEPRMALESGDDGLDIVRRILEDAPDHLNEGGGLLCEIGRGRALLEEAYPKLPFLWLDTEDSSGEVFWLTREQMVA